MRAPEMLCALIAAHSAAGLSLAPSTALRLRGGLWGFGGEERPRERRDYGSPPPAYKPRTVSSSALRGDSAWGDGWCPICPRQAKF